MESNNSFLEIQQPALLSSPQVLIRAADIIVYSYTCGKVQWHKAKFTLFVPFHIRGLHNFCPVYSKHNT
jgi:hypothetical protein